MKIITSTLNGAALDWAVAQCVYAHDSGIYTPHAHAAPTVLNLGDVDGSAWVYYLGQQWNPSTNWLQGGPIIERERIATGDQKSTAGAYLWTSSNWTSRQRWLSRKGGPHDGYYYGPTLLIAGMRCYVAKIGDDVDIPEELI